MNHLANTVAVIVAGGTVQLTGRAAACVHEMVLLARELTTFPYGRLVFNFDPTSMHSELTAIGKRWVDTHAVQQKALDRNGRNL